MKLDYLFNLEKVDPEIVMEIPFQEIEEGFLSIAHRHKRNRSDLYQQKHISGVKATSERKKEIADLNITIEDHFKTNFNIEDVFKSPDRYLVIGTGDCSANLFRASFDYRYKDPLFYLQGETIHEKEYYGFIISRHQDKLKGHIQKVRFSNQEPVGPDGESIPGLHWMFCSTPLVFRGRLVDSAEMAKNNYDLRHLFGKEGAVDTINEIYEAFNNGYPAFSAAIDTHRDKIRTTGPEVEWYHAAIGIKGDSLMVVHHIGSLKDLAEKFISLGAEDAVLLDSGGSCAVWANWNYNGMLAHHWFYRPNRGAVAVFKLKGKQKRT